jgi:MoxR-like ATPase
MESCKNCPSFIPVDEVPIVFGKVTGAPMCAKYGHVLGRPGLSETGHDRLAEVFALKCDSFGQPRPDKPVDYQTRVVNPDPTVIDKAGQDGFNPASLTTCRQCVNLVRADVVQNEIGYAVDLCKAKGKLVLRPQFECKGCPMATEGSMSDSTDGLEIRAEYREGYVVPMEYAVNKVVGHSNSQSEPTTYATDAPVSDEDRACGIRAWRKVTDPHGTGNEVFLPIFEPSHFADAERALIPQTGDEEHPELYVDYAGILYSFAVESLVLEETLCLQGPPGVGKTEFARWAAWLCQLPFRRFSFTSSTEVEDMIGKMMYDPEKGTYFQWGRIPLAYNQDGVIVFDELNLAENAIREALRSCFDNSKQLVLDAGSGAIVPRGRFSWPVLAQNDSWDIRNVGTVEMADADYNRLSVVHVDLPPESVERHIITERCKLDGYLIPAATLELLMSVSEDIREMSKNATIPFTWGVRQTIKVARKTRWYNLVDSFKRAALDFYDPETTQNVIQTITDRMT